MEDLHISSHLARISPAQEKLKMGNSLYFAAHPSHSQSTDQRRSCIERLKKGGKETRDPCAGRSRMTDESVWNECRKKESEELHNARGAARRALGMPKACCDPPDSRATGTMRKSCWNGRHDLRVSPVDGAHRSPPERADPAGFSSEARNVESRESKITDEPNFDSSVRA